MCILQDIEERVMIIRDSVLTRTCQLYYDYFGPHNRNLYGKQQNGTHDYCRQACMHADEQAGGRART